MKLQYKLYPQASGNFTCAAFNAAGEEIGVLSCGPNGMEPPTHNIGPYELCSLIGPFIVFQPGGPGTPQFYFLPE